MTTATATATATTMSPQAAALVVHDLKNELGALEAALQQLALQPAAAAAQQAHRQCQDLRARMVSFLTLHGSGQALRAICEDESPIDLLQAIRARGAERAGSLDLQVHVEDVVPPFWYFDRRLVTLALDAALHNALRFANSWVRLGAQLDSGQLVFTIDDDGPGLGHGQVETATSTGLGTELCRAVGRAHGVAADDGGVSLSNRPQGGARFELRLPT